MTSENAIGALPLFILGLGLWFAALYEVSASFRIWFDYATSLQDADYAEIMPKQTGQRQLNWLTRILILAAWSIALFLLPGIALYGAYRNVNEEVRSEFSLLLFVAPFFWASHTLWFALAYTVAHIGRAAWFIVKWLMIMGFVLAAVALIVSAVQTMPIPTAIIIGSIIIANALRR